MLADTPERSSWTKAVVIVSTIVAIALETTIAGRDIAAIPMLTVAAAAIGFAAARRWPEPAAGAILALSYLVPAMYFVAHGHFRLYFLTPWKGAFLGALLAGAPMTWAAAGRLRFALVTWALAVAVTWPMVALREIDWMPWLIWSRPTTPSSAANAVGTAVWVAQIAQVHLLGLLWVDWIFERFAPEGAERFGRFIVRPLLMAAVAGALLSIYQGFVNLRFLTLGPWADLGRASGPLADANASGALTALWVAIPLAIATSERQLRATAILAATSACLLLAVWTSGSRTAFFVAAIGLGAIVHLLATGAGRRLRALAATGAVLVAVGAAVIAIRPSVAGPISRAAAMVPNLSSSTLRDVAWELLWSRNGYGEIAAVLIRDAPLQGVGVGAFHELGIEYAKSVVGTPVPPDNAQNWYKHQLAELGVIGSVGWIVWVWLFALVLLRARAPAHSRALVLALKYTTAGFGLASLLGMPGQSVVVALTFWTLAAWLLLLTAQHAAAGSVSTARSSAGIAPVLVAVFAGMTAWSGFHGFRLPFRAERLNLGYRYGWYEPFDGPSGHSRTSGHAVVVPQASGRWLKLTVWVEHPDADDRPVLARVWIDRVPIVQQRLPKAIRMTKVVELPGEGKRFVLETKVDRTFLPPDRRYGEVGLNVDWEYVRPRPIYTAAPVSEKSMMSAVPTSDTSSADSIGNPTRVK